MSAVLRRKRRLQKQQKAVHKAAESVKKAPVEETIVEKPEPTRRTRWPREPQVETVEVTETDTESEGA